MEARSYPAEANTSAAAERITARRSANRKRLRRSLPDIG
jgi:hypothetical protein